MHGGWDADGRRFTIVAGLTQEGVDACGMLDRGSELWLDWSTGDDASLHQFRCDLCVVLVCGCVCLAHVWLSFKRPTKAIDDRRLGSSIARSLLLTNPHLPT